MTATSLPRSLLAAVALLPACTLSAELDPLQGVTPARHPWFPISSGLSHANGRALSSGSMSCGSCHGEQSSSFSDFTCTGCHEHEQATTDRLHLAVSTYSYTATSCYSCHDRGDTGPFDHAGISRDCASCHSAGEPFAALPVPGFSHRATSADCSGCHTIHTWKNASGAPTNSSDPSQDVPVTAQIPSYAGTSVVGLSQQTEILPMVMNHATDQLPAEVVANCGLCHPDPDLHGYYPGVLHASLTAQPTGCSSCHAASAPEGFVGPEAQNPRRSPSSGEMKHDAVEWVNGARTATAVVKEDCGVCHRAPADAAPATWATGIAGDAPAKYHASLSSAQLAQPTSCLDCHANSRPTAPLTQLAGMPAGLELDHQEAATMGDCGPCHSSNGDTQWTSWSKGRFHLPGSDAPKSCLPCHQGERPTSTASWKSTGYTRSPFDYVGAAGFVHGDGQDCAFCHGAPGTGGSWGGAQSWMGGTYAHAARNPSSCLPCHQTQRPSQVVQGFNHATTGTGECRGCHRATVEQGRYVDLSDWKGGQPYPGSSLIAAPGQFVSVSSIALTRGAGGLVSGMTSSRVTLNNAVKHTSAALPAALNAGEAPNYQSDFGKCWHCHKNTNGKVTDFTDGQLHASFASFRATPGGAVAPLGPPSSCVDCHDAMTPPGIVERAASSLSPMDHSARFAAAATLGGASVTAVDQIDCSLCHSGPGTQWADGEFHAKIGAAEPSDCVTCHYPLMADAAMADVVSSMRYAMKHRSSLLGSQACQGCHPQAKGKSTVKPSSASLWQPGSYHGAVASQPGACNDCHSVTAPSSRTQSASRYSFSKGGTSTNGGQWMSHSAPTVASKDCVACHAADASATSWSESVSFHKAVATGVTACNPCHGGGSAPGASDNRPSGLTDSSTVTTSSAAAANTPDQMTHADINAANHDCNFCHTQIGASTAPGIQGREWAQALFHRSFSPSNPLVMNGTTGRCSNCHMNVKPGPSYAALDHSAYTATSAQDCSACHAWPGTNASKPNWLGASGGHATSGPTASSNLDCNSCHGQSGNAKKRLTGPASNHYGGVSNGNTCISCHINFAGFKDTVTNLRYAHANAGANGRGCVTCHAFVNQVYTTLTATPSLTFPMSAGGHTFSQTRNVTGSFDEDSFTANHTSGQLASCGACHQYSTTTSSTNVWTFKHRPSNPGISNSKGSSGCKACH